MTGIASARRSTRREGRPRIRVQTNRKKLITAGLALVAFAAVFVVQTAVALPPHVVADSQRGNTDSCAICHRAHTADAAVPYRSIDSSETTGTSLLIASDPAAGDVSLCFTCHGVAQLGSNKDVQSRFLLGSVHSLAPTSAPYGPSPLYCSSCHDSHGSARVASDTPYPALLRSFKGATPVYEGEEYCATCHEVQPLERWAGLTVFKATTHYTAMAAPATGAGIRCSICHDPHGSAVAPLLVASLTPTSAPATFTVTADDRTFCAACHGAVSASWTGTETYATSSHASSTATTPISARWVPGDGRLVGECQVCHAPMGRSDGSGGAIPKLLEAKGRVLCDSCHSAGGVASTNTSSQAYPSAASAFDELAVVYAPGSQAAWAGRVSLYGRTHNGADQLIGPREYDVAGGSGPADAGDVDFDNRDELVVASLGSITIMKSDPLTGLSLSPTTVSIPGGAIARDLVVANVVHTSILDRAEIIVLTTTGNVLVLEYNGTSLTAMQVPVTASGSGPWGIAVGDVVGATFPDLAVTSGDGVLRIYSDDGSTLGVGVSSVTIGGAPIAPAIGNLYAGAPGSSVIAVCDSVSTVATIRLFTGTGSPLASYPMTVGDAHPVASAIGDVLWNAPSPAKDELAVSFVNAQGDSTVVAIPQSGSSSGLNVAAASSAYAGTRYHTSTLLVRDVDGDGRDELAAASAGNWATDATAVAPRVTVWRSGGAALSASPDAYLAGGLELAGGVPSLVLADFGPALPSRHPIDEVAASAHVSTETAGFTRHVTCSDCHNSHEATQAVAVAPAVPGPLLGAWGVSVTYPGGVPAFGSPARSATGYGICFKCHSSYIGTDLDGRSDVAAQFSTSAASVHAIVGASSSDVATDTFVSGPGWNRSSVLGCTDCHGTEGVTGAGAREVHTSDAAPVLKNPYAGEAPDSSDMLCFDCHKIEVYAGTGDGPGLSAFASGTTRLHNLHVAAPSAGGHGLSCSACHVSHGSAELHLLRSDAAFGWTPAGDHGGSCAADCHTAPGTNSY